MLQKSSDNSDHPSTVRESTKHQIIVERLTVLARQLGPGERLPTFVQLREELGVSVTTLVAALSDLEAQGILNRRHGVGIFVARDALRRNIALLCDSRFFQGDSKASPFWPHLIQLAWQRVREKGNHFALYFVVVPKDDHEVIGSGVPEAIGDMLASDLKQGRIHGVLGAGLSPCVSYWLQQIAVPFVAFAGYAPHRVQLDLALGTQRGVEALAARGCRRIAFWGGARGENENIGVFRQTLAQCGLPFEASLLQNSSDTETVTRSHAQLGEHIARTVFGPESDPAFHPDGVLCEEDTLARGALPMLARLGLQPGKDLQFATHTNAGSPLLFGFEEGLIRIEMDPPRLIEEMVTLLEAQMEGRAAAEESVLLAPTVRLPVTTSV